MIFHIYKYFYNRQIENNPSRPEVINSIATAVKNNPKIFEVISIIFAFIFAILNEKNINTSPTKMNEKNILNNMGVLPISNVLIIIKEIVAGPVSRGVAIIEIFINMKNHSYV